MLLIRSLFALSLFAASSASAQILQVPVPAIGSSFDYLWADGQLDRLTVTSTSGNALRLATTMDWENDGEMDDQAVQSYDLAARLWLSSVAVDYSTYYAASPGHTLPPSIENGRIYSFEFSLIEGDGLFPIGEPVSRTRTTCNYNLTEALVQIKDEMHKALEVACVDKSFLADGTVSTDPEDAFGYREIWSLELGMPVLQEFGYDTETGQPVSWSTLVDYSLN